MIFSFVEFLGFSEGGTHFFHLFYKEVIKTCDNNSVNLLHDATDTICCVTDLVEHTHRDVTGSVDRKLWYDNDMY